MINFEKHLIECCHHFCSVPAADGSSFTFRCLTEYSLPDGLERELKGLQGQQGSQLTVYGQWVPQLLKKIDIAHSKRMFIKKPVGPIGDDNTVFSCVFGSVGEVMHS